MTTWPRSARSLAQILKVLHYFQVKKELSLEVPWRNYRTAQWEDFLNQRSKRDTPQRKRKAWLDYHNSKQHSMIRTNSVGTRRRSRNNTIQRTNWRKKTVCVILTMPPGSKKLNSASITLELLQSKYDMPLAKLSIELCCSLTHLKKICRRRGINRWPYRQLHSIEHNIKGWVSRRSKHLSPMESQHIEEQIEGLLQKKQAVIDNASSGKTYSGMRMTPQSSGATESDGNEDEEVMSGSSSEEEQNAAAPDPPKRKPRQTQRAKAVEAAESISTTPVPSEIHMTGVRMFQQQHQLHQQEISQHLQYQHQQHQMQQQIVGGYGGGFDASSYSTSLGGELHGTNSLDIMNPKPNSMNMTAIDDWQSMIEGVPDILGCGGFEDMDLAALFDETQQQPPLQQTPAPPAINGMDQFNNSGFAYPWENYLQCMMHGMNPPPPPPANSEYMQFMSGSNGFGVFMPGI